MVLATDMSCHFQQVKCMKTALQQLERWHLVGVWPGLGQSEGALCELGTPPWAIRVPGVYLDVETLLAPGI